MGLGFPNFRHSKSPHHPPKVKKEIVVVAVVKGVKRLIFL